MTTDQPELPSSDDQIDLREVFAALQRRWPWVFGGGLLGLALAGGVLTHKLLSGPWVKASLVVNVAQGPCYSRSRQLKAYREPSVVGMSCFGERESILQVFNRIVESRPIIAGDESAVYSIGKLNFGYNGREKSKNHLLLKVTAHSRLAPQISAELAQIQKEVTMQVGLNSRSNGFEPSFGADWIRVQNPSLLIEGRRTYFRPLALGLLGGLVVGVGCALIADRRSNRVYSQAELLRRLGHPLRLGLPAAPWGTPAVSVLVGQLAAQLDQKLSWRVLSIARQHQAVAPLTQLLQQFGADLKCDSADPLLSAVLRFEPRDQPTGLLLVVEPGFNSARALDEACLLISQMSSVSDVGVVLIGAPLPEELNSSVAG